MKSIETKNHNENKIKELKGQERLITKAEREYIEYCVDLKNHKKVGVIIFVALYITVFILSALLYYLTSSLRSGIITFIVVNLYMVAFMLPARYHIVKLLKQEEIWVREAYLKVMNKYHLAWFEINDNGKEEVLLIKANLNEKIYRHDKVIIVKVHKTAYVYKARD
ncbi:hypothetical protein acsn021_06210 [Anaerocolumna cellulosilytica]|uniref:Uncharacterized protein n=1 Tax=Anaerocolumna cellulosilytica TaxID=433286 RepID=A0A6S6R0H9_9FIRM|nr:hypothetical protein [Anaerocolumna cellulosilytica]MBB5198176.1 hypothetical protein [Anaerocolumna cellulosilytica]BCJ93052.1 hypothetical protein acsn021_06210 [Anaerocolumna cellulosilytica]